jgi:hypothetical protein
MGKHLMLSTDTTVNWTLPANTDIETLKSRIEAAMSDGHVIRVTVQMPDGGTDEIILNGTLLPYAAVVETPEQRPMASII